MAEHTKDEQKSGNKKKVLPGHNKPVNKEESRQHNVVLPTDILSEDLRMWAALSFAVILLGIGIPLWWKTTEVYRVSLPYSKIDSLNQKQWKITMNIFVHTKDPSETSARIHYIKSYFKHSEIFDVNVRPAKLLEESGSDMTQFEDKEDSKVGQRGDILFLEMNSLHDSEIVIGNHRTVYFHPSASNDSLANVLSTHILQEQDLVDVVTSLVSPGSGVDLKGKSQERRVRAAARYGIVFTTINPEPETVRVLWDQELAIQMFVEPMLEQLKPIADHDVKSQWLYYVHFGQQPKRDGNDSVLYLTQDQLPQIISPLEKKLGSGVSKHPCLHFVLYTAQCKSTPLYFKTDSGVYQNSLLSPRWGGIQVISPADENCVNGTVVKPDYGYVMSTFIGQLRYLLGIHDEVINMKGVSKLQIIDSRLRDWELDVLYRLRILEQVTSARLTLQSLSQLLGEISNIVINEEVGSAIKTAVMNIEEVSSSLQQGDLDKALAQARVAYGATEMAFTHPSLLSLLYFPDDQKYAVYIPLFLPIMIPVMMSIKYIRIWISCKISSRWFKTH